MNIYLECPKCGDISWRFYKSDKVVDHPYDASDSRYIITIGQPNVTNEWVDKEEMYVQCIKCDQICRIYKSR